MDFGLDRISPRLIIVLCVCFDLLYANPICTSWYRASTSNDDSFYRLFTETKTFSDSRDFCRSFGVTGDLAILRNEETISFFQSLEIPCWIGLTKPDTRITPETDGWLWLDGTELNTTLIPWKSDEPNNPQSEYCVYLDHLGLYDHGCEATQTNLICEIRVKDCSISDCPIGSFLNSKISRCELCPIGRFSMLSGQTACTSCTQGKSTTFLGVVSLKSVWIVKMVGFLIRGIQFAESVPLAII